MEISKKIQKNPENPENPEKSWKLVSTENLFIYLKNREKFSSNDLEISKKFRKILKILKNPENPENEFQLKICLFIRKILKRFSSNDFKIGKKSWKILKILKIEVDLMQLSQHFTNLYESWKILKNMESKLMPQDRKSQESHEIPPRQINKNSSLEDPADPAGSKLVAIVSVPWLLFHAALPCRQLPPYNPQESFKNPTRIPSTIQPTALPLC